VQKERARVTSRPPRNICCAQMPKNERLRFWKSHTHRIHTLHAHTVNISPLLSPSQLEHSIYTLKASQPPQFGKHSRPTIYTTPSASTTAAISVIIDERRFVVSGFPYTYRYIYYILYYKHALRRLPVAVPRMYLYTIYPPYILLYCRLIHCTPAAVLLIGSLILHVLSSYPLEQDMHFNGCFYWRYCVI